ncbi:MAG: nuclear transport factor 2 family protein [Actinomycetota bacterium]
MALDIAAFKKVFETVDTEAILGFYADDVEHVEIDAEAPPRSPRVSGKDGLREAFTGIAQAGIKLRLDNALSSQERAACTITCEFPGGGTLMSNTIFEIKGDKIVRQLDIQVTDPG